METFDDQNSDSSSDYDWTTPSSLEIVELPEDTPFSQICPPEILEKAINYETWSQTLETFSNIDEARSFLMFCNLYISYNVYNERIWVAHDALINAYNAKFFNTESANNG